VGPVAAAFLAIGLAWGVVADRISARWPEHGPDELEPDELEPGELEPNAVESDESEPDEPAYVPRPFDWRTIVCAGIGGLALAGVALRFPDPPQLWLFAAWVVVLVLLLATDLDQRLLPDLLTLPLIAAAVVSVLAGLDPFLEPAGLPLAALVAVVIPVGLYALSLPFGAGAFGLGDVKFLIGFGLIGGPERFLLGLVSGVLLAGLVIGLLLAARRITLRSYVPYGPFLIIGALWAVLVVPR
jgi:leader peptidase (prepilin peptidase)/N-methyltransferase